MFKDKSFFYQYFIFLVIASIFCITSCSLTTIEKNLPAETQQTKEEFTIATPRPKEKVITPTFVTLKNTMTKPVVPNIPARTITPSQSSFIYEPDFKIAYRKQSIDENKEYDLEIWVIEPPYEIPRKIYSYSAFSDIGNEISWSNSGNQVTFGHLINNQFAVTTIDINTLEKNEFKGPSTDSNQTYLFSPIAWSNNDRWLAFSVVNVSDFDRINSIIIDTNNEERILLGDGVEFVAWLPTYSDRYLYIQHHYLGPARPEEPNEGDITIHIGSIEQEEPILTINDMKDYAPRGRIRISMTPDGKSALAFSYDSNLRTNVSMMDLINNSWELLPLHFSGSSASPGMWSPNGRWMVLYRGTDVKFWDITKEYPISRNSVPVQNFFVSQKAWTPDSAILIYQDGQYLYAVDPNQPQSPQGILDISNFTTDILDPVYLWVPPNMFK